VITPHVASACLTFRDTAWWSLVSTRGPAHNETVADRTKVRIAQGHNLWRLLRTDRDGASAGEIPQMAAAAVRYLIRGLEATGAERGPLHELVATAPREWRFGWVRPLKVVSVSHEAQPMGGTTLADRQKTVPGTIPTVRGQRPWYILVDFWWRAPDALIDYPGFREGLLGRSYELNGADWTLDAATFLTTGKDPGDQTWSTAQGKAARELAAKATEGLGSTLLGVGGMAALVLLYLLSRKL
jgi:hypothetical protein